MNKNFRATAIALGRATDLSSALAVVTALEKQHGCLWRAVGDREGNYSTINLGSDPGHAFVERVTNAIDSVIEAQAVRHLRGARRGKLHVPASPREAVEAWFGVTGGRISNLEARSKKGSKSLSRQDLAENVIVRLLDGSSRRSPTLEVRDHGIGLTAALVPKTILSLNEQNKIDKPYLAGAFGQGGSTAMAFSPHGTLFVTRRQPDLLEEGETDEIAITFARYNELDPEKNKNGRYEYLVLPNQRVIAVPASEFPEFEPGTRVIHFNMEIAQYSQRLTQLTGSLWWLLQNTLFDPVLPIRAEEHRGEMLLSRKDRAAGIESTDKSADRRTISGNYTRLMDAVSGRNDEPAAVEHHNSVQVELGSAGFVRVNYWVLRQSEEGKDTAISAYVDEYKPIAFTLNGQTHGFEDRRFTSDRLSLPYLAKSLVVQVEIDGISGGAKRQVLSTTRDRLRRQAVYQEMLEKIAGALGQDEDLDDLNRRRKEALLSRHSEADRAKMKERFARLMERFNAGVDVKAASKAGTERGRPEAKSGSRDVLPPLPTRDEPTFLRIANTQKPIPVRIDRNALIRLESDAPDGYLANHVHARVTIACEPEGVVAMESRSDFRAGRARLTLKPNPDGKPGSTATLNVFLLTPGGKSFSARTSLKLEAPAEEDTSAKGDRSKIAVPDPIAVYRADWPEHGWDEAAVAKVVSDKDGRDTQIFVNMENMHFVRFLKSASYQETGVSRMKNNFLLYLAFYSWMQYRAERDPKSNAPAGGGCA